MENVKSDLQNIFNYVRDNPSSNARKIGKVVDGGKSRANHYLYGYEGILFTKRGVTPPEWSVLAGDAYEKMIGRLLPQPVQTPKPSAQIRKPKASTFSSQQWTERELPPMLICYSCDLPIKPNGLCGCS